MAAAPFRASFRRENETTFTDRDGKSELLRTTLIAGCRYRSGTHIEYAH